MPTTKSIEELRASIDSVDMEILALLNRRANHVLEVGKIKARENKEFYVPEREQEVLKRLMDRNAGPFPNQALKSVFREIMSGTLSLDNSLRTAKTRPSLLT